MTQDETPEEALRRYFDAHRPEIEAEATRRRRNRERNQTGRPRPDARITVSGLLVAGLMIGLVVLALRQGW